MNDKKLEHCPDCEIEKRSIEALSAATVSEINVAAKKIATRIIELRALRKAERS
jgi:hypothetical protein